MCAARRTRGLIATDSHIDSHFGGIDNSIDRDRFGRVIIIIMPRHGPPPVLASAA
jgi:hypothetical protein